MVRADRRYLALLSDEWWCLVVPRVRSCCLVLLGAIWGCFVIRGGAWCCLALLGAAWCCLVVLGGGSWCVVVGQIQSKLKSHYFAGFCGSKHVPCMSNLLGIFVLGHYGALYTQNDENDVIFKCTI